MSQFVLHTSRSQCIFLIFLVLRGHCSSDSLLFTSLKLPNIWGVERTVQFPSQSVPSIQQPCSQTGHAHLPSHLSSREQSRACPHHSESITDSHPLATLYSEQIFQDGLEMRQRQFSNCKYLESSSPFIFVSVFNLQNTTHLSPTQLDLLIQSVLFICVSPKTLLALIFMYTKKSACHPHCDVSTFPGTDDAAPTGSQPCGP